MVRLQCKHCYHEWEYKGKREFYTSCPNCHYMVNIKKGKEEERDNRILIKCDKCGYSWEYSGKRDIARCPECKHRIHVKRN